MIHTHTFEVEGKTLSLETGRVAKQAGGAVLLGMGETVVFAQATLGGRRPGTDFLPLTCDYEERKYAVGKIPGGFMKRGGRPSDKAILVSRLMDRPLRPLFPKGLRNDVSVTAMTLAVDHDFPSDILAVCAAGAALQVSDIPFNGPCAGVRVAHVDGKFIAFPSSAEMEVSSIDLCVAGHKGAISMVEAGANEVTEELMIEALNFAHKCIKTICIEFEKSGKMVDKPKKEVELHILDKKLVEAIKKASEKDIAKALDNKDKTARNSDLSELQSALVHKYRAEYAGQDELLGQLNEAVDKVVKEVVRKLILEQDKRPDGRRLDEIRDLEATAGLLPKVHGSGLFTRGQTQVLTVLTLGTPGEGQTMDGIEVVPDKRYMHFYNFPSYSVGEVRPMRGPGRREIGHGMLAERALQAVLPLNDPDFPYTMLLISECLESNGSTSMASVCGSTLALMDAGIPIKAPVAGIAMGLMSDGKTFKILTDIQGMEDFCGDMDFKVAGTRDGITALQLDTKLDGIPEEVLANALKQAKGARFQVLDVIEAEISEPRADYAASAPRITTIQINPEKIGALIGPGGANIRKIVAESGCQIDVQQDGRVLVAATDGAAALIAVEMIKGLTSSAEIGAEFTGPVTRIMGRGVFVEYMPGKDGMVPLELLASPTPGRPDDVVSEGDMVTVKVYEVDDRGRVNLTALGMPQSLPSLAGNEAADGSARPAPRERSSGDRDRGGRGGGYGGGGGGGRGGDRDRGPRRDGAGGGDRDRGPRRDAGDRPPREGGDRESSDTNARFRPRN